MQATLLLPNGQKDELRMDTKFTLEEMQKLVLGPIQISDSNDGRILIMNEEGKLRKYPENELANAFYPHKDVDSLVGPVIICTPDCIE